MSSGAAGSGLSQFLSSALRAQPLTPILIAEPSELRLPTRASTPVFDGLWGEGALADAAPAAMMNRMITMHQCDRNRTGVRTHAHRLRLGPRKGREQRRQAWG